MIVVMGEEGGRKKEERGIMRPSQTQPMCMLILVWDYHW